MKKTLFLTVLLLISNCILNAADDIVKTDWDNNANITRITQAADASNSVKTDFTYTARYNSAMIKQAGTGNIIQLTASGSSNRIENRQSGNDNKITMNINGDNSKSFELNNEQYQSAVMVKQDGANNDAEINISSGARNNAAIFQNGDESIASILQKSGNDNRAWIEQSEKDVAAITQSGNGNTAMIFQQ